MEKLIEKYLDRQNELKKLHTPLYRLQDDMEMITHTYLNFKGNKYYDGECVKVEYDNSDIEVGILQLGFNSVYVLDKFSLDNPHYHKMPNFNRRVINIEKLIK